MMQSDVDLDSTVLAGILISWAVITGVFLVLWCTGAAPAIDSFLDAVFSEGMGAGNQLCAFTSRSSAALVGNSSLEAAP